MDPKHHTINILKKIWLWISEQNNHRAIVSLAAVLAVIAAVWLGIQQNGINDKLLKLEELRHEPLVSVVIEEIKIQEPLDEYVHDWGVMTKFSVSNVGFVPVEILGYRAGELVGWEQMNRGRDNEYFKQPPEPRNVVQIVPVGQSKTLDFGNVTYNQKPNYDAAYKLRVYFKEFPNEEIQCIEVRYYHETKEGFSDFTEFQYSCSN